MSKWLPLLALFLVAPSSAEIYKWVDEKGNVHYSDEPAGPGARPLRDLPGLSTYSPRALPATVLEEEPREEAAADAQHPGYRMIRVVSPEPEATVRDAQGNVPVFVALDPVLREGDYLKVILDGTTLPGKYTSTVIQLQNLDRGEHRVAVAVYDGQGRKLGESESHVFYLHRPFVRPGAGG